MLRCIECDETTDIGRGWKAYLGGEPGVDEDEVVIYCPACAEREFGPNESVIGEA
jgi:hypothetical protein